MKKAITPVIAIVLLIMIVVSAAGVSYFWLSDLQSSTQSSIQSSISGTLSGSLTTINIISAQCTNAGAFSVTMQNTRSSIINNGTVSMTINDDNGSTVDVVFSSLGGDLNANSIRALDFNSSETYTSGENYALTLTMPSGNQQTTTCTVN